MTKRAGWELPEGAEIAPGRCVLEKLGGGKRYEVYRAWDERLFAEVVVKIVRPDQVGHSRAVPDLEREALTLERLAHPMLVRHFGVVLDGDRPHIVLEHLPGPTLRALIKSDGALAIEQVISLGAGVCGVLHYMSTESVVHLDVKPSNIVMQAPPKLIDLSVSRSLEAAAKRKRPIGTRKYMSPEQCVPDRLGPISSAADIWGAGATLYEAASGRRAFETPARGALPDDAPVERRYPQLVSDPAPLPDSVPARVGALILSCLERDPRARPTAAAAARAFAELQGAGVYDAAARPPDRTG